MGTTPTEFEFDVTLDDLLYANGLEGLNDILDERMAAKPEDFYGVMPTDISYELKSVTTGDEGLGLITIVATFTPESLYGDYEADEED